MPLLKTDNQNKSKIEVVFLSYYYGFKTILAGNLNGRAITLGST
jgi:hypothetical protein